MRRAPRCYKERVRANEAAAAAAGSRTYILPETGSLALVLEGLSEALLFGVCGGIGFGYWVFEYKEVPYPLLSVFTRHAWDSAKRFTTGGLTRLGITYTDKETTAAGAAEKALLDALAAGRGPLVWVSAALAADSDIPPGLAAAAPHVMVAQSFDPATDTFTLLDRSSAPLTIARAELAESRSLVRSEKNRMRVIEPPAQGAVDGETLRNAVLEGIAACVRELTGPPPLPAMAAPNSGLAGLEKLAGHLADLKDKRGWPKLFPPGLKLQKGLTGLQRAADAHGTGALRGLYADFLDEAAALLQRPALREVATTYRAVAAAWSELAGVALPADVRAWQDGEPFPLHDTAAFALLSELSARTTAILEQERAAVGALTLALSQRERGVDGS